MTTAANPATDCLRALVLEDEWHARDYLARLVDRTGLAHVVGAVSCVDDASESLRQLATEGGVDVVFVDVHLVGSEQTGLVLVRQLAGTRGAPAFVLATAMKEHALEAFELGAIDYLLKPFSEERVRACLERVAGRRPWPAAGPTVTRVVARSKRNLVFLDLEEVWAFESSDRLTMVHSDRGTFDVDLSLAVVEQSFGRRFLRVHRNWLVSERHIKELERESGETALLLEGAAGARLRVPVSRDRAQALRNHLVDDGLGIRRR